METASTNTPCNGIMLIVEKTHIRLVKVACAIYDSLTETWTGRTFDGEWLVCHKKYFYNEAIQDLAFEDARNYVKMGCNALAL